MALVHGELAHGIVGHQHELQLVLLLLQALDLLLQVGLLLLQLLSLPLQHLGELSPAVAAFGGGQLIPLTPHSPLLLFLRGELFVPLATAPGVPDGADDAGTGERVVAQQPGAVGQVVVAVRVGAGVRVGHGGDDGGLHHPLEVLAGGDCIDGGYEGTVGAGHVDPVLLVA